MKTAMVTRASATLVLAMIIALAEVSAGATISVQKDGSGDFNVIQAALDVAADGDTVLIGPGEYLEETSYRLPGWGFDSRAYGRVKSDNLTIIGAGVGQTVVGPVTFIPDYDHYNPNGFHYSDGLNLTVRNMTIRNCYTGLRCYGALFAEECAIVSSYIGVGWETVGTGGWIRGVDVRGDSDYQPFSLLVIGSGNDILIEGCTFFNSSASVHGIRGFHFSNCIMRDYLVGIQIYGNAQVYLDDCKLQNIERLGIGFFDSGGLCEIRNSTVNGGNEALRTSPGSRFVVEKSTLIGGARAVLYAKDNPGPCAIHNCDLVKGTGPIVRCENTTTPVTHDLTNNYWGTTDPVQIQQWIIDINDDPSVQATVLYDPFASDALPVEGGKKSFGGLKAMFR